MDLKWAISLKLSGTVDNIDLEFCDPKHDNCYDVVLKLQSVCTMCVRVQAGMETGCGDLCTVQTVASAMPVLC